MAVDERVSGLQSNNPHISAGGRLLLENLVSPQLVKKIPVFYENRRCIIAFRKPAICPYSEPHQPSPRPHPIYIYIYTHTHIHIHIHICVGRVAQSV